MRIPLYDRKELSKVQVKIEEGNLEITGIREKDIIRYIAWDTKTQSKFFVFHYPNVGATPDDIHCPRLHIGRESSLVEAESVYAKRTFLGGCQLITLEYTLRGQRGKLVFDSDSRKGSIAGVNTYGQRKEELERLA